MAAGLLRRLLPKTLFRQPEAQEGVPFLTALLSRLILLNYEADPALLAPRLPAHTDFAADGSEATLYRSHPC